MDLSYRAQLRGWKFIFLPQLTAPAELPPDMNAFKTQQHRWTKGGTQTAMKLLPRIWMSKVPLKAKVEATFHLTSFTVHLFVLALVLMLFPAVYIRSLPMADGSVWRMIVDMGIFTLATLSASTFYVASQFELFGTWRDTIKYLPFLMALGVGMCVSNSKAVLEALFRRQSEFVRTPKFGAGQTGCERAKAPLHTRRRRDVVPYLELAMGLYVTSCLIVGLVSFRSALSAPFLVMFATGFYYVSLLSFHAKLARQRAARQTSEPAAERQPSGPGQP